MNTPFLNRAATVVLTILITAAILAALNGAWNVTTRLDACQAQNPGQHCPLLEAKP